MKHVFLLAVLLIAGMLAIGCRREPAADQVYRSQILAMKNVTIQFSLWGRSSEQGNADVQACAAEVERLELILNNYRAGTTLSRVNALEPGQSLEVEQELIDNIEISQKIHKATGGRFDPTIWPLIALWKQAAKDNTIPTPEAIDAARDRVGLDSVVVTGNRISLKKKLSLDLGAVAKGYIVDKLVVLLQQRGVRTGLVNAGGDLKVFGPRAGGFSIGIQDPAHPGDPNYLLKTMKISRGSLVTSGSYERFSMIEGRKFSHIIDPLTGWPVENDLKSVSIIALDADLADGLATGIFVLGFDAGRQLIDADPAIGGLLIGVDGTQWEAIPVSQRVEE